MTSRYDFSDIPSWWTIADGNRGAKRNDLVQVVRDSNAFVVEDGLGRALTQSGRTASVRRPRLFRYLKSAIEAADKAWPIEIDGDMSFHEVAWRLVVNNDDWRAPIDAVVAADKLTAVVRAIWHYTATETVVTPESKGRFRVKSIGYRMGPAGP